MVTNVNWIQAKNFQVKYYLTSQKFQGLQHFKVNACRNNAASPSGFSEK